MRTIAVLAITSIVAFGGVTDLTAHHAFSAEFDIEKPLTV